MSSREKLRISVFLLLVIIVFVSLSNIPLIYGYLNQPADLKFMGIIAGVRDANFYFMMMRQAEGWRPILENYFAAGEPNAIVHGFFWFFLGKLSKALGTGCLPTYHAARVAAAMVFVPVAWYLVSRFLSSTAERVTALMMLVFGAGGGWVFMLSHFRGEAMRFVPVDVGTPEASSFFTLMTFPHLSFALILIGLCFALLKDSFSEGKTPLAVIAGACGIVLGFIHAVNLVVIFAVLAVFTIASIIFLRDSRPIRPMVIFGALSVWSIAYYAYLAIARPELLPQAPVRSPTPLAYLVGFAPFVVLSAIHIARLVRGRTLPRGDLLLICWAAANSLLLYSYPALSQEARAVLGLQMPLVILSTRGIFSALLPALGLKGQMGAGDSKRLAGTLLTALIVVFTFPATFCNIIERVSRLEHYPEVFSLRRDEYAALQFLERRPEGGAVLSADWVGNYVPRLTGRHSYLGQYDLPSHDTRLRRATEFFSERTAPSARRDFLKRSGIGFVYRGRDERTLGRFDPGEAPYLELIFEKGGVSVYRVDL